MIIKLGIIGFGGMGKWHAQNAPRAGVEIAVILIVRKFFELQEWFCNLQEKYI